MITKIFDSGTSNGQAPVNYLLGDTDHTGQIRSVKPELVLGNPNTTIDLINSIDRKFKYTSGVLSFRYEEKPTPKQQLEIINDFRKSFLPGLNPKENFNDLWVLHKDKGHYELHFLVVREELSSNKSFNIAPPGNRKDEHFKAWSNSINQKNGWFQVIPDPLKVALSGFETKAPNGSDDKKIKSYLSEKIRNQILKGKLENRDHLINFLKEHKCEITRVGSDYISVVVPGANRARRFKGEMFSEGANYKDLIAQHHQSKIPKMLSPEENKLNNEALNGFIADRLAFNTQAYLTQKKSFRRPRNLATAKQVNEVKEYLRTNESLPEKIFNKPVEQKSIDVEAFKSNVKKIRNKAQSGNTIKSSFSSVVGIMNQIGDLQAQLNDLNTEIGAELNPSKNAVLRARAMALKMQIENLNKDLIAAQNRQYQEETKTQLNIT